MFLFEQLNNTKKSENIMDDMKDLITTWRTEI